MSCNANKQHTIVGRGETQDYVLTYMHTYSMYNYLVLDPVHTSAALPDTVRVGTYLDIARIL